MKIKEILELKSIVNEEVKLNLEERILSIKYNSKDKMQSNRNLLHMIKNIHVISVNNKKITLMNREVFHLDDEDIIMYIQFEHIYVGIFTDNEEIDNICKYRVEFEDKIEFNQRYFIHNNYKVMLNTNFIELINKKEKNNDNQYLNEFLNIYELICLCIGYFPRIDKVEIYINDIVIEQYGDLIYLYNSSNDIIHNRFSLADVNDINGRTIHRWKRLKECVGQYPILGLFVSQMKDNHYSDYILVTLLQSIDGYCKVKIQQELPDKSNKDKEIINFLINSIADNLRINNKDKKELYKFINQYHDSHFEDYLRYIINNSYVKKVFFEEIFLNRYYKKEEENECGLYVEINSYLTKSVNERNKISHMTKKNNVFNILQSKIAYYKWLLAYRIIIIKELGIEINEDRLKSSIRRIRKISKDGNIETCNSCKYRENCVISYKE